MQDKIKMKKSVVKPGFNTMYSNGSLTMQREYGKTPNGNKLRGQWVLRDNGKIIDFDKYRNDIEERHNFELESFGGI